MHWAEIGEDPTDCSAVSDHNASWPGPHNSRSTTIDNVTAQDAPAANPSHGTAPTRQGFQGNLPSGLGTLTAATCQITLLDSDPGKKSRSAYGSSRKAEPFRALKGTAAARIHTQEKAVTSVGGAADRMSLSRRTMQHVRPKSAPGMTIFQPSDRTRVEGREALRLALENEKLREENAQLRELLALAGPASAGSAAPSAAGLWGAGGGDSRPKAAVAALRESNENLMRCRVAQLERQVCRAEAELQRRRKFAAEAERAVREVTQRLVSALPEEDAPDDAWLGAVDRLTGLRDWGRGMLCRLRDMRCCVEEEAEAPAPDLVEKEQAVAWSIPYFIPGGSDFAPSEQPLISVRGLCMGEGTLLADSGAVHALECQLAHLAPDLAAAAATLRSLILPNLAGLAPSVASDISEQMRRVLASLVFASAKLSGLACLLPTPMPDLADLSRVPPRLQARLKARADVRKEQRPVAATSAAETVSGVGGTCRQVPGECTHNEHLRGLLAQQISHSSQLLHQITAALSAARQQHEEPVSRARAALKAVVAAHGQVQAWPASELCLMRLLKQLALHAATLRELPKLLGSCHASSQDALQLVHREAVQAKRDAL